MTHRTDECFDCGSKLDGQNCPAGGVHDLPTDESVVEARKRLINELDLDCTEYTPAYDDAVDDVLTLLSTPVPEGEVNTK